MSTVRNADGQLLADYTYRLPGGRDCGVWKRRNGDIDRELSGRLSDRTNLDAESGAWTTHADAVAASRSVLPVSDRVRLEGVPAKVFEGDNFTVTAFFEDRVNETSSAPTTVDYHVDNLTTSTRVVDWTSVTPGSSVSVAIQSSTNAIHTATDAFEVLQITVTGDKGLTFQCSGQATWKVFNRNIVP